MSRKCTARPPKLEFAYVKPEVSSLRPRMGNVQKLKTQKNILGDIAFGSTPQVTTHTHIYELSRHPYENPRQPLQKENSANFYSTLLRFRSFGDHSTLVYFYLSRWLNSLNPIYNVLSYVFITIQSSIACLILILVVGGVTL